MEQMIGLVIQWRWSPWTPWDAIRHSTQKRNPGPIPHASGVYEVKRTDATDAEERLLIGRGDYLDRRVRDELVKGDDTWYPKRRAVLIDVQENTSLLEVRWAEVELHIELESLLHRKYKRRFGTLPKFVDRT
jgi:hypothetical protein